jgi:hypothetical protein
MRSIITLPQSITYVPCQGFGTQQQAAPAHKLLCTYVHVHVEACNLNRGQVHT